MGLERELRIRHLPGPNVFITVDEKLFHLADGAWNEIPLPSNDGLGPVFAQSPTEVYIGRNPISVYDGESVQEVEGLEGYRAFDFAADENGTLFVAGDDGYGSSDDEKDIAVLFKKAGNGFVTVVETESLFMGSVAASNHRVFAVDTDAVWMGTCPQ